jgi:peroxiredoxin
MICSKCGKENSENAQLCWFCGGFLSNCLHPTDLDARTSRLAIASLVLAILSPFTLLISTIPALILGIVALVQIKRSKGWLKGTGLAIAGITAPVYALPVMAMLIVILMPALIKTNSTPSQQPVANINLRNQAVTAETGKSAPSFTLRDLSNKQVCLSDFKDKVIILDFWATWCPPCVKEIPHFVELDNQYKAKRLAMVGISVDTAGTQVVNAFVKKYQVSYPILMADSQVRKAYGGITAIPTTFVIDRSGIIRKKYIGYQNKAIFEADIKTLLAEMTNSPALEINPSRSLFPVSEK